RGRHTLVWAGALLVALLGVGVLSRLQLSGTARQDVQARPVVVGVMEIRDPQGKAPRWMLEVTRDGLNTILSKVGAIRVYSKQKIDFLRVKRDLSEIEVADTLGMTKMVSATLEVADSSVQIDIEIVDIGTGLLEASESVRGSTEQLMELQNQIAL